MGKKKKEEILSFTRKVWMQNMSDRSVEDLSAEWTMPVYGPWFGGLPSIHIYFGDSSRLNLFGRDTVTCFPEG